MTMGINLAAENALKLTKKCVTFASPHIEGFKMTNAKYYNKSTSAMNPKIETQQFINNDKVVSEFSSKKFQNGYRFEVYRLPDEIIKILKNSFGEIKAFKSSVGQHNETPAKAYENIKNAMQSQTHNFLK